MSSEATAPRRGADTVGSSAENPYDFLGIGFGPSNLALAVCVREEKIPLSGLFVERRDGVAWHPGMLIDGARMQISFLKDLVSLRNPASAYSFLQYTKEKGRLERFVNLNEFRPTRIEYDDYLKWVAGDFTDQVRFGTQVNRVTPVTAPGDDTLSLFRVETEDVATGRRTEFYARNVVHAGGGRPSGPQGVAGLRSVVHSSEFLTRFPSQFPDRDAPHRFVVVGGGQSAGEIAEYLLGHYDRAEVHIVVSGYTLQPTDNSPFVNEQFYAGSSDAFYHLAPEHRTVVAAQLRDANYGVVREDLLDRLFNTDYLDQVKGRRRLHIHGFGRLSDVRQDGDALVATVDGLEHQADVVLPCDGVVLATGYDRSLDPEMFADVLPLLVDEQGTGGVSLQRSYRARTAPELRAGLYLQGFGEGQFGFGDTLLSLLPFRSKEIADDLAAGSPAARIGGCPVMSSSAEAAATTGAAFTSAAHYPPAWYLEHDSDKLYALMERFRFATLVSARSADEPLVTHLPLILDRSRGDKGVLFGHLDRANAHADLVDGRRMLAVFHGPNSYMPPSVFESDPLPTWNSMSVHVRGRVRMIEDRDALIRGLIGIAEHSESDNRLRADDPRIDRIIGGIIGFEIEIDELVGRFKLSQDRDETDRRHAAVALARASESGERDFIEYAVGISLITEDDPRDLTARSLSPLSLGGTHE
ncbi:SidA/IucD/PvdA family monooxygenase [Kitasatospora brasiliensis]|uniref:SidA/IucD/PvdA family monooxygenase n=1 Tax=Kitasatospora brasiliensis TaxID=3058040 RepID=UPI00292E7ABA|nr:SidA/IucD/PvdA family monooxygenase [Kitasatospora sp. K002]